MTHPTNITPQATAAVALPAQHDPDPPGDPWLTLAEIAAELRVNPATVRLWIARGRLPATRPGQRKLLVRRSDVDRMLGHHSSRSQAPVSLNDRIDALERHLHTLYAQRAGTTEPGEDWGWCAACGRNTVIPSEGEDTCRACAAEPATDHAGRQP
jgi:excisionase family DNA binding protein